MIPVFLRIALRNFLREKFYSSINLLGLSVGIAVAMLITLFIIHESSYDRFHRKAGRIFRIGTYLEMQGNATEFNATFPPLAEAMKHSIPEVKEAVRMDMQNDLIFKVDDKLFKEDKVLYADSTLFSVFNFKVLAGDVNKALAAPYSILLTPALAEKYFNHKDYQRVIGESVSINRENYQVTGIIEEAPANSHLHYTAIASLISTTEGRDKTWNNLNLSCYILLHEQANVETVLNKIPGVLNQNLENYERLGEEGIVMKLFSQPLTDIHLHSNLQGEYEPTSSVTVLYIFGSIAIVVLVLACVNFINLVTARSANRAKEVGVRKVLGSASAQLIRQFTTESVLLVFISTLIGLGLVELFRSPFTMISGKELPFEILLSPEYLIALIAFVLVLGLAAGSYPAFYLASFKPAQVLKGKLRTGFRGGKLRNGLVMLQFAISIILITCTLIVQRQLSYMRSKKLGFDKENILIINNANRVPSQEAFLAEVRQLPQVNGVAVAMSKPIDDYDGALVETEEDTQDKLVNYTRVDHDYLEVLKYDFVEGRNFSRDFPSDSAAVVINERAAQSLFGGNALGKKIINGINYTVIGVVRDFNFESLKKEVRPLVFYLHPQQEYVHVRLNPGNYAESIAAIERIWKSQASDVPFTYSFLDESYDNLYKEEVRLGWIFNVFTSLALLIACLGLIGLAAYMAEQRKKEISVRKVLGASVSGIVTLLSKEFLVIILLSFVIAVPVAYYLMNEWLSTFAYRVNIPFIILLSGGLIVLAVAMLVVSYQSIRVALINPVDSLKEE